MRLFLASLFCFLLTATASAKPVVLISDIDDTIKISHVRVWEWAVIRAFDKSSVFSGMPELYQVIRNETNASIYYLSNGYELLMGDSHSQFLDLNNFPGGHMSLRQFFQVGKLSRIQQILDAEKPQTLILIGDNGEQDILTYDWVAKLYPKIKIITYIRSVYSERDTADLLALRSQQNYFVTPVEILTRLMAENILKSPLAEQLLSQLEIVIPQSYDQYGFGGAFFPSWMDCSRFRWQLSGINPDNVSKAYRQAIDNRCR